LIFRPLGCIFAVEAHEQAHGEAGQVVGGGDGYPHLGRPNMPTATAPNIKRGSAVLVKLMRRSPSYRVTSFSFAHLGGQDGTDGEAGGQAHGHDEGAHPGDLEDRAHEGLQQDPHEMHNPKAHEDF
jgi:hypothetical protein